MLKWFKIKCLVLIYLGISLVSSSQSSDIGLLDTPLNYILPTSTSQNTETASGLFGTRKWKVFVCRTYCKSFKEHKGKDVMDALTFMDDFYVIDHKGKRLHLVKDPKIIQTGDISENYTDFGWDMDDLLLWEHCLVDEEYKTNKKGILFYSDKYEHLFNDDEIFFQNDETKIKFKIVYIYMIEEENALVGKTPILYSDEGNKENSIIGWIPVDDFSIWDNNTAFEPVALKDQKIEGIHDYKPIIFSQENYAKKYSKGKKIFPENILWIGQPGDIRWSGKHYRFPLLTTENAYFETTLPRNSFIEESMSENYQQAFGTISIQGISGSLFYQVFLLSRIDLVSTISNLEYLIDKVEKKTDQRPALFNYIKVLMADKMVDTSSLLVNTRPFDYIHQIIFNGYNSKSRLNGFSVVDILYENRINSDDLNEYINDVYSVYYNLMDILNTDDYMFSFSQDGLIYYWLEESMFP